MGARAVTLSDGRRAFVKEAAPSAIAAEVAGLAWLRVPGGPPLPEVLEVADDRLATSALPTEPATEVAAERFGGALARLHLTGATAFGAAPPGGPQDAWFGDTRMVNRSAPQWNWPTWFAHDRILPYLRQAVDDSSLTPAEATVVQRVCDRLPELAGPDEPPARLHGDLWGGNVIWSGGAGWLIDPAAHGGHRESDLALLALFGCPHLERIRSAYGEVAPLADGWQLGSHCTNCSRSWHTWSSSAAVMPRQWWMRRRQHCAPVERSATRPVRSCFRWWWRR